MRPQPPMITYCPLLTVCYLCYNWRPHCWAATAVHHCKWLFVTSLPGYDHPPLCSTSFTKSLLTQREHERRPLDLYRQALPASSLHDLGQHGATVPCTPQQACTMAAAMKKEPFTTVELPPPGLGDRPPCSRHGFRRRPIRAQPTALDARMPPPRALALGMITPDRSRFPHMACVANAGDGVRFHGA